MYSLYIYIDEDGTPHIFDQDMPECNDVWQRVVLESESEIIIVEGDEDEF